MPTEDPNGECIQSGISCAEGLTDSLKTQCVTIQCRLLMERHSINGRDFGQDANYGKLLRLCYLPVEIFCGP